MLPAIWTELYHKNVLRCAETIIYEHSQDKYVASNRRLKAVIQKRSI